MFSKIKKIICLLTQKENKITMTIRNIWFLIFYGVLILSSIFFLINNLGKFPKFFKKVDISKAEELNIAGIIKLSLKKVTESGIKNKNKDDKIDIEKEIIPKKKAIKNQAEND